MSICLLFSSSFSFFSHFSQRHSQQIILIHICFTVQRLEQAFRLRSPMILFFWRELLTLFCKESLFLHMSQSLFFLHVSPLALSCSTSKCCEIIIKFASDAITSSKSRKKFFSNATKSASKSENDSYNPLQFNALDCLSMETTWYTFLLHLSDLSKRFQD